MKQLVVFSPKAINSAFYKTNFLRLSVLNDIKDEYESIYLTFRKDTERTKKELFEASGFLFDKVISYSDHLSEHFSTSRSFSTWREYLEKVDLFPELDNVEQIIMAGNPLSTGSGINREKNAVGTLMDTQKFMGYMSTCNFMVGMLQMINVAKRNDCKIHNLIRDPLENTLSHTDYLPSSIYEDYHDYDSPSYKFHRFDGYQHWIEHEAPTKLFMPEKSIVFTFGFSVITHERVPVYDRFVNGVDVENPKNRIFIRNKFKDLDTFIDRDTYLDYIEQSKYTLQVPSYDQNHFSTARLIESLHRDCLPFISNDTVVEEWAHSFDIGQDLLDELVVDYSEIQEKIEKTTESRRLELLEIMKEKVLTYKRGLIL